MPDPRPDPRSLLGKSALRTLVLCILAGAIAQAALAWSILLIAHGAPRTITLTAAEAARNLDVPQVVNPDRSTSGPPIAEFAQHGGLGWLVSFGRGRVRDAAGKTYWGQTCWVRCGLPFPSFDAHWGRIASDPSWPDTRTAYSGPDSGWSGDPVERSPAGSEVRVFPLHPIWRGQLLNTAIFAAAIFVAANLGRWLLANAHRARREIRLGEGRCASCGYPLLTLLTCPECGHPRSPAPAEQPPPDDTQTPVSGQS